MNEMEKILQNEELMEGIAAVETAEELAELLAQHNIQLEDGLTTEKAFELIQAQQNGELNEESLDDVAGGIAPLVAAGAVAAFTIGGAALTFIGGYAVQKYKNAKAKKKKKKK